MSNYEDNLAIEKKWQEIWEREQLARVDTSDPAVKGTYLLVMLPYPSGDRLHVGHARTYFLTDALHRFLRQRGQNVFCPMGWDAFGLPAENYAIQKGIHPRTSTLANIAAMKEQFRAWGVLYDWSKEVTTCEPEYYRWNQWFFLKMLEKGLAVRKKASVNWCPSCETVLANEQAEGGTCERCKSPVTQRELEQWFLKITDYADSLLEGLDGLEKWPEKVRTMQRNWIGRSVGADLDFVVPALGSLATHPAPTQVPKLAQTPLGANYKCLNLSRTPGIRWPESNGGKTSVTVAWLCRRNSGVAAYNEFHPLAASAYLLLRFIQMGSRGPGFKQRAAAGCLRWS